MCQDMLQCLAADVFHGRAFPPHAHLRRIEQTLVPPADAQRLEEATSIVAELSPGYDDIDAVDRALIAACTTQTVSDHIDNQCIGHRDSPPPDKVNMQLHALRRRLVEQRPAPSVHYAMQQAWQIMVDMRVCDDRPSTNGGWGWGQALCLVVCILADCLERDLPSAAPQRADIAHDVGAQKVGAELERVLTQWAAAQLKPSVQLYSALMALLRLRMAKRLVSAGKTYCRVCLCKYVYMYVCEYI